jgi:hypothetical protein
MREEIITNLKEGHVDFFFSKLSEIKYNSSLINTIWLLLLLLLLYKELNTKYTQTHTIKEVYIKIICLCIERTTESNFQLEVYYNKIYQQLNEATSILYLYLFNNKNTIILLIIEIEMSSFFLYYCY